MLTIEGSYGEGGGQILRTALSLAAILSQPIQIQNIRAGRKEPGLAAQHLTAVRAAAQICRASLAGDRLHSTQLTFEPQSSVVAGEYAFDVSEARPGGSAGAASLVLQTVLLPLSLVAGESRVTVRGGTHVAWSPSFHYLRDVYLPMADLPVQLQLSAWGWYPVGRGEIEALVSGPWSGRPVMSEERGGLQQIGGRAIASSLPAHIAQRMWDRAASLLADLPTAIEPERVRSQSPGAGIFLVAEYEAVRAGFTALGKKGKPAEQVAEEAVEDCLAFHHSRAVWEKHLADQLILPVALSGLPGSFRVEQLSQHMLTNLWLVEQFLGPVAEVDHQNHTIHFIERDTVALLPKIG